MLCCSDGLKTEIFQQRYCDEPSMGGIRLRRHVRNDRFKPELLHEYRLEDLFQYDRTGWLPIHHAVFNGHLEAVLTMLAEVPVLVNLPTIDDMQTYPILLAVMANNLTMIERLLDLQADFCAVDWYSCI
jgi:ankyrin repeat protein